MSIVCVAEILQNGGGFCAFLPNSEVSDVMLIACYWPWRDCLHPGNPQTLIRAFSSRELVG